MVTPPTPISRGYIVCLKKQCASAHSRADSEADDGRNRACRTVAAARGAKIANVCCSEVFNGFSCRGELSADCLAALKDMTEAGEIDHVEPDFEVRACMANSFPDAAMGKRAPWGVERVGTLDRASTTKIGGSDRAPGVDVFVLDTGVESTHPYLNVASVKSVLDAETEPNDLNGHGTMCAGIIGAIDRGWASGETIDVVGVAPGARIHGVKVLDKDGAGFLSDIISGVEEIVRFKRDHPDASVVANLSLGGYVGTTNYTTLDQEIVEAAEKHKIAFVIAAGNDSSDAALVSPAHVKEAITVGSYDRHNRFSSFSNYGHAVDILAPGTDIQTTTIGSTVATASGTSFAAPFVSGAAALYVAARKSNHDQCVSPTQVAGAILSCARNTPLVTSVPHGTSKLSVDVTSI